MQECKELNLLKYTRKFNEFFGGAEQEQLLFHRVSEPPQPTWSSYNLKFFIYVFRVSVVSSRTKTDTQQYFDSNK